MVDPRQAADLGWAPRLNVGSRRQATRGCGPISSRIRHRSGPCRQSRHRTRHRINVGRASRFGQPGRRARPAQAGGRSGLGGVRFASLVFVGVRFGSFGFVCVRLGSFRFVCVRLASLRFAGSRSGPDRSSCRNCCLRRRPGGILDAPDFHLVVHLPFLFRHAAAESHIRRRRAGLAQLFDPPG